MHGKVLARVIHGLRPGKEITSEVMSNPAILYVWFDLIWAMELKVKNIAP